jgi:hypothetical protein
MYLTTASSSSNDDSRTGADISVRLDADVTLHAPNEILGEREETEANRHQGSLLHRNAPSQEGTVALEGAVAVAGCPTCDVGAVADAIGHGRVLAEGGAVAQEPLGHREHTGLEEVGADACGQVVDHVGGRLLEHAVGEGEVGVGAGGVRLQQPLLEVLGCTLGHEPNDVTLERVTLDVVLEDFIVEMNLGDNLVGVQFDLLGHRGRTVGCRQVAGVAAVVLGTAGLGGRTHDTLVETELVDLPGRGAHTNDSRLTQDGRLLDDQIDESVGLFRVQQSAIGGQVAQRKVSTSCKFCI